MISVSKKKPPSSSCEVIERNSSSLQIFLRVDPFIKHLGNADEAECNFRDCVWNFLLIFSAEAKNANQTSDPRSTCQVDQIHISRFRDRKDPFSRVERINREWRCLEVGIGVQSGISL